MRTGLKYMKIKILVNFLQLTCPEQKKHMEIKID